MIQMADAFYSSTIRPGSLGGVVLPAPSGRCPSRRRPPPPLTTSVRAISVERASPDDATAIHALIHELAEQEGRPEDCTVTPGDVAAWLTANPPLLHFFVSREILAETKTTTPRPRHSTSSTSSSMYSSAEYKSFTSEARSGSGPGTSPSPAPPTPTPTPSSSSSCSHSHSPVVGYGCYGLHLHTFDGRLEAHIEDIVVFRDGRGQGHGNALFRYLLRDAHHMGAVEATWGVHRGNLDAMAYYQRFGGSVDDRWQVMSMPLPLYR